MRNLIASFIGSSLALLGAQAADRALGGPASALRAASDLLGRAETQLTRAATRLDEGMAAQARAVMHDESLLLSRTPATPSRATPTTSQGPIAPPPPPTPSMSRIADPGNAPVRTAAAVPAPRAAPNASSSPAAPAANAAAEPRAAPATAKLLPTASAAGPASPSNPTLERASQALKRLGKKLGGA
ncbi:MAG: hypothetical protein KGR22_11420 [Planctomycetes bacterium]|nr:hypothetical protein [Planctomycetota bacterium]